MEPTSWSMIWKYCQALSKLLRNIFKKIRGDKFRIFISMQMSHLPDKEYTNELNKIMPLVHKLRQKHYVYFINEFIPDRNLFDKKKFNYKQYLNEIDHCDLFIAIINEKIFSSIYFEAGYAFSMGKQSFYFVTNPSVMPLVMENASLFDQNIKLIIANNLDEMIPDINRIVKNIKI